MRNRYRWMYHMTGQPGWMRFGFSPGWLGRSPMGLGPAAQYLMSGTWPTPQMDTAWQLGQIPFVPGYGYPQPGFPTPYDPWGAAVLTPEQELNFLKANAELLEEELASIEKRIHELEGDEE